MTARKASISVFFPFLNDWGTVGSLVTLAISTVKEITDDWEVILINDGSDKSDREALGMIVRQINLDHGTKGGDRVKIIDHRENKGYGGALRAGFEASVKDMIFYTDCDAQYDPRELALLYAAMKEDVDMVNGYKIKRNDPLHRVIAGRFYHHLVKFFFKLPIRDTDCDFRLIRRRVFNPPSGSGKTAVRLFENTGTICTELVKKVDYRGYKIAEVPVHHFWRTSGKSQFFNFGRLAATGDNLFRLWWKLMVRKNYDG